MTSIYEYLNYRIFLQDFFKVQKELACPLTHRKVLEKIGVTSTGFLSNVIAGKKNLNGEHSIKLAQTLQLARREQRYFKFMVQYTQARSIEEKKEWLDKLMTMRKTRVVQLSESQFDLFSKWYYVYIRDLLVFIDFTDDFQSLARMLDPPVKPDEAQQAINDLAGMGLIAKDASGFYRPTDRIITTGDEVRSVHLANFQLTTMDMAKRALERCKADQRDISFVSLTLSADGFDRVKTEIQSFRKKLLEIARDEQEPDRVCQCNIQMFPVARSTGGTE